MSSSFIQIKPIGSHQMGMLSWNNPLTLSSQDFSQARRRVSCNLFGVRPEKGAINETYRQEEQKRIEQFKQRYICFDSDSEEPSKQQQQPSSLAAAMTPTTRPPTTTTTKTTTTNIAESRLSSSGGESLIEKELREHEMKLKQQQQQQRKKTANCNEKLVVAGDRIKSRSLKLEELTAAGAAAAAAAAPRTLFVDSSKCASSHGERPKPYARQQSSITDYYPQRKTVVCNNSRTAAPEIQSAEEVTEVLPHLLDEADQFDSTTATSSAVSNNESSASSSSSTTTPHQCEQEPSQEQKVSLHTMTTDVSVELA